MVFHSSFPRPPFVPRALPPDHEVRPITFRSSLSVMHTHLGDETRVVDSERGFDSSAGPGLTFSSRVTHPGNRRL